MPRWSLLLAAIAVLSVPGAAAVAEPGLEKVVVATNWRAQAAQGGFYQALAG